MIIFTFYTNPRRAVSAAVTKYNITRAIEKNKITKANEIENVNVLADKSYYYTPVHDCCRYLIPI